MSRLDPVEHPLSLVVAAYLRGERAHRRWTQQQMADHLGVKKSLLADVEAERRTVKLDEVGTLCVRLQVPFVRLFMDVPGGGRARKMLGL